MDQFHSLGRWAPGEELALETLDAVFDDAGVVLYNKYIEQKAYPFAVDATIVHLVSELQMAFQAVPKQPKDAWLLESQPMKLQADSWARSCIPVRKATEGRTRKDIPGAKQSSVRKTNVRSAESVLAGCTASEEAPTRITSLQVLAEVDVEEMAMREAKDQELKRKRDEMDRTNEKLREAEAKEAKLSKAKDELNKKLYTFDTEGNILVVQPPNTDKLPSSVQLMNIKLPTKSGAHAKAEPAAAKSKSKEKQVPPVAAQIEKIPDGVQRLVAQQPSMIEAMALVPGVSLEDNGQKKSVAMSKDIGMTRAEYLKLLANDGTRQPVSKPSVKKAAGEMATLDLQVETSFDAQEFPIVDAPSARAVSEDMGHEGSIGGDTPSTELVKKPHMVPSNVHSVRNKRLAIGCRLGARDRMPVSGTARLAPSFGLAVPPQPPLGATMGHGLIGDHEEFYFPNEPPLTCGDDSPKSFQKKVLRPVIDPRRNKAGRVVARNHQLVAQLKNG
eukprot:GEMP01033225.1.p1 GENE.GEMP01033225.1~~GEMP01033225.1.p1  ORF type:complete len:501 (+),score=133.81 GEMP01033225.1:176-1678(+)